MAFEACSAFSSTKASSLETKFKEKFALFLYSDTIAKIFGWFYHLAIAFRVGSSMFSTRESQFSLFGILRFFTAFAKKSLSSFATYSQFFNEESFLS